MVRLLALTLLLVVIPGIAAAGSPQPPATGPCMGLMVAVTPGNVTTSSGSSQRFFADVVCGSMGGMENVTSNASVQWSLSGALGSLSPLSGSSTMWTAQGQGNGTIDVTAIFGGMTAQGQADVSVGTPSGGPPTPCPMVMVSLDPSSAILSIGESQTVQASVYCGSMMGGMQDVTSLSNLTWSGGGGGVGSLSALHGPQTTVVADLPGNFTLWATAHYQGETTEASAFLTMMAASSNPSPRFQLKGTVSNGTGTALPGALVQVLDPSSGAVVAGGTSGAQGLFRFILPGGASYELRATTSSGMQYTSPTLLLSQNTTLDLTVVPRGVTVTSPSSTMWMSWAFPSLVTLAFAALVVGMFFGSEVTQLAVLFPPLLLYARLKRDRVLDHFVRGRIFGYVEAHPGVSYSEILRALHLANGVGGYHLYTLEREQFIVSRREGSSRRYYPHASAPSDESSGLSTAQNRILSVVRRNPGICQVDIARELGVRRQNVNYNVGRLARVGVLRLEGWGFRKRCFEAEA